MILHNKGMRHRIEETVQKALDFVREHSSSKNENLPYYLIIFFSMVAFVVGINYFVELTEEISGRALKRYDREITDFIISYRTPERNKFFQLVTELGDFYAYLGAFILSGIVFFWLFKSWKFIVQLLAILVLSGLSNVVLKNAINRTRPSLEHMVVVETLSYPSGHAMSAMAFYGFLVYLLFQIRMPLWLRFLLSSLFIFLIVSIGVSRIYLGVHFPSDVAGGFIGGLIWVAFCIILFNVIDLFRKRKNHDYEKNLET